MQLESPWRGLLAPPQHRAAVGQSGILCPYAKDSAFPRTQFGLKIQAASSIFVNSQQNRNLIAHQYLHS